jgi:hypothetical protein
MKGKKFVFIFALILLGFASLPLAAQNLLPSSIGGRTASSAPTQVPAQQIEQLANDRAAILREYGITSGERVEYANGADKMNVTLYRMEDPSAAFGAFTFLREPDMAVPPPIPAASYAAAKGGRALLVVGDLVMDVESIGKQLPAADLNALAQSVSGKADRRPYPPIATFLPHEGLIPGTERYVLGPLALADVFPPAAAVKGDWAGFASSAEAMEGHYRVAQDSDISSAKERSGDGVLLLILYPTQQLAADRYNELSKVFALNVDPGIAGNKPAVYGTRTSALIALLSGVESREAAANLLNKIHYSSQVTWNEPSQKITDPSISTIVVGAIVDTGAIVLLAIAASLGFGGFRILAKFVAPGRIFDRNIEILQLGISSKPIDVKDFYILNSPR